jgi:hypothetical protein
LSPFLLYQCFDLSNILFAKLILLAGDLTPSILSLQDLLGGVLSASGGLPGGMRN